MWKMTRFLYNKRFFLAEPGSNEDVLIKGGVPVEIAKLLPVIGNTSEVRVDKGKLVSFFVLDYFSEYKNVGQGIMLSQNPFYAEHFRTSNAILNSCLKKEYIYHDKGNKELVYISTSGRHFGGDFIGLWREWAIYLKPLGIAGIFGGLWALRELVPHINKIG